MAYRSDIEALEARKAALEAEVAERTRQRDEVARMVDEARAREHAAGVATDRANNRPARRRRRMLVNVGVVVMAVIVIGVGLLRIANRSDREARLDAAIAQLERFTNEACACTSMACARGVNDRMMGWGNEMARKYDHDEEKPDEKTTRRIERIVTRYSECIMKAYSFEDTPAEAY